MTTASPDTEELIRRAQSGDGFARGDLLQRHRDRLRKMVAARFDRRLAARIDPSDVVQEVLAEADRKLDRYLGERPLPFYPWLRELAWEHLATLYRRHVKAEKRSVRREEAGFFALPDESAAELAKLLVTSATGPGERAVREEQRRRVRDALQQLPEKDREVLVLRHLEQLSVAEVAEVLGTTPAAVKMRHVRALERLRSLLEE